MENFERKGVDGGSLPVDRLKSSLSVAIVTLNEEANLRSTLESVRWADEIVVVDSGSTDGTLRIAGEFGAKVIAQQWLGFAAQKNFAIAQCSGEWVLSLDADEAVDAELQAEIRRCLVEASTWEAASVRRKNYFLGRWIRHGGFYPDRKIRLFRRGAVVYEDRPVHESIKYGGETGELSGNLEHRAYPTLAGYIEHMNRYSSLGAEELRSRGRRPRLLIDAVARPLLTFVYNYVLRRGFLDGREGLLLNLYHAFYVSLKYAKAWARRSGQER